MIESVVDFTLNDPFPLLPIDQYTYAQAKSHAEKVDRWLGLKSMEDFVTISNSSSLHQEVWKNLPLQTLMTPYLELRTILDLLNPQPGSLLIDLGCAYGRMAHIVGRHHSQAHFIGYEIESVRTLEGLRLLQDFQYTNVQLLTQDLSDCEFQLPEANFYFIYDFGSPKAIQKTMEDLRNISQRKQFKVVARGRSTRQILHQKHPWLTEVNSPEHYLNFSIYSS